MSPDEIAEDAFWGAQDQDDTRQHIQDAIEGAVQAERSRIAALIQHERGVVERRARIVGIFGYPYASGLLQGYVFAHQLCGAGE